MNRAATVSHLNETNPNNRVAGRLLPTDWSSPETLNVLVLAQWGIQEAGISVEQRPVETTTEALEQMVLDLQDADPEMAMAFVEGSKGDEVRLALEPTATAKQAALRTLESIKMSMEQ